jgi:mannose-6-phosphate isomerase-like protein (cupin superfamily)
MKIVSLKQLPQQAVSHNTAIKKRVMVARGELGAVTNFSQAVFPAGEVATAHAHDDMGEVFFVLAGSGEMDVDGETFPLAPGVCVLVEAGEQHEIRNTGNGELVINYFGIETT